MNIKDIIDLAKAGYKISEIKELLAIEIPETPSKTVEDTVDNKADFLSDTAAGAVGEEPKAAPEVRVEEKEEIDYKKLYEESQAKLAKATNDLKAAQKANVRQPVKEETMSDDDLINDLANAFI